MKILHLSIVILTSLVFIYSMNSFLSQNAFGQDQAHPSELEQQLGNVGTTKLFHDGSVLILNQTTQKLAYKMGENIAVDTELINIGNKTVEIRYCEPWVALEIKDQTGIEVWPNSQMGCIPEFTGDKILQSGEHVRVQPWGITFSPHPLLHPVLYIPGNYTVTSVAVFTFDMNTKNLVSAEQLWSKPLQITVLPEQYIQNETNSSVSKISSNQTAIQVANPLTNPKCVDKIMTQERAQDVPIDNARALDLATNYTQYKLKTLGHNYTLNRIYHDFSIDSCTAQIKDVIVEFVEKNSLGHSLITVTEDLGLDRVKSLNISQVNDEPVTHVDAYMTPTGPQIDNGLILLIVPVIASILVVLFFIFKMRKKK